MSAFGERISAKTNPNTKRVEVEQWGDEKEPMVLFATPLNCGEFGKSHTQASRFSQQNEWRASCGFNHPQGNGW